MSDYPDYYPPFMQDFHQQKELFKAFFVWRLMMDARNGATLAQLSNFRDFMCLFASMIDFLFTHGWQVQRTRRRGEYPDIDESVQSLRELERAWMLILDKDGPQPANPASAIDAPMERWRDWLEYMPESVRREWEKRQ